MLTGQQTLHSISSALKDATKNGQRLSHALSELTEQLAQNGHQQTQAYQNIAAVRLDEIESHHIRELMDGADHRAQRALKNRTQAKAQLQEAIQQKLQQLSVLDTKRQQASNVVDQYAQLLIDCEAETQTALDNDSHYQQQLSAAEHTDAIADRAEEKMQQAQQDRQQKGRPFEADSLFMYLWQKDYGLPTYQANGIIRQLDDWVAKLCRYDKARVNYWMLLEIPKRLSMHAETVRDDADASITELQQSELAAAEKYGVNKAQQDLSERQQALDNIDQQYEQLEQSIHQSQQEEDLFSAGKDYYFQQALNELAQAMQQHSISELQRLTYATVNTRDDLLVNDLVELREQQQELKNNINQYHQRQKQQRQRVRELEQVRSQFKRRRFDDVRSGFNNGGLINVALEEFLKGVLDNGELWRTIERQQRHRDVGAWPDYGSGGLGRTRRRRGSTWHWPGSGGGFRLPRSGGSSSRGGRNRGGFRTGGGF